MHASKKGLLLLLIPVVLTTSVAADETDVWKEVQFLRQKGSATKRTPFFNPEISMAFRKRKKASVKSLIAILRDVTLSKSTRIEAAIILGDLRASEAVDALIENLTLEPGLRAINIKTGESLYLCYAALLRIGKPASRRAIILLRTENTRLRRTLLAGIVGRVEGRQVGKFLLQQEIAKARTPKERRNLQAGLKAFLSMTANERTAEELEAEERRKTRQDP